MANKTTSNPTIKLEKRDKRLLARHVRVSNDTRKTGLNNNDMIVGPTGSGKTRGYVMPLLAESTESLIISDTKGNLYDKYSSALSARGYKVIKLHRIKEAFLELGDLKSGEYRRLKPFEVKKLKAFLDGKDL